MSGSVVVDGSASQSAGATGHGGLVVIRGDASARCGISMKGVDIVVHGSVGHMSAFMAQKGRMVVCGDAGEALGDSIYEARLYVRGDGGRPGRRLRGEGDARRAPRGAGRAARARRRSRAPSRRSSGATARRAGSTTSTSTTRASTRDGAWTARVRAVRPQHDRRDPARRARGHLRHPRVRRQAAGAALRRPALPRRKHVALPARGLPRALRHRRHDRLAPRSRSRSSWTSRSRSPA